MLWCLPPSAPQGGHCNLRKTKFPSSDDALTKILSFRNVKRSDYISVLARVRFLSSWMKAAAPPPPHVHVLTPHVKIYRLKVNTKCASARGGDANALQISLSSEDM